VRTSSGHFRGFGRSESTAFLSMARRLNVGDEAEVTVAVGSDAAAAAPPTPTSSALVAEQVGGVKALLTTMHMRDAELLAVMVRAEEEHKALRAEMASAESELNALVNAPVSGGRDPFEWLPDELIVMIVLMLPFEVLWSGACERVCQRWSRLVQSALVKRRKRDGRWAAYEEGVIKPRELEGHTLGVRALAVGLDGKLYSGSDDTTIRVWSGVDGTHLQTLVGHMSWVCALAVGLDGKVYSGSYDKTIRVWSGVDGTHLQTLVGHTDWVEALAVGLDGKVYSGSWDKTIRVWSGDDGTHLQTLVGHTSTVYALAVGLDGKMYSGSSDMTIRVWSGVDSTHLQTLLGHTNVVWALAVGLDGKVYSGSWDKRIRVWSGDDSTHLHTLKGLEGNVFALAVMRDGTLVSGGGHFVENEGEESDDEDEDVECAELTMW
jgi:WD40 repeat protein